MRVAAGMLTLAGLGIAIGLSAGSQQKTPAAGPKTDWIKLTFGLDQQAKPWDGAATIRQGRILQSAPWSFERRDRFDPLAHKWFCTTVVLEGRSASSFAEPQRGVLLEIEQHAGTQLDINTKQGSFSVNLDQLAAGRPQNYLDGRAAVERLGTSEPLPKAAAINCEDDYPAWAIDGNGKRWIAWIGYEDAAKRDHLFVLNLDDSQSMAEEIVTSREQIDPQLAVDGGGQLWLVWSAGQNDNWDVWAARRGANSWMPPQQLTTARGSDLHLRLARGPQGSLWLVWQAFREGQGDGRGQSDILAKRLWQGRWSDDIVVANTSANEWEPAVSIDSSGQAWIAYDSYVNGNYDVYLTSVAVDQSGSVRKGRVIPIATTADFEAHATVAATSAGGVWVAFDAAGPNWGKDYTRDTTNFKGRYGETLHASRRLGLRVLVDGKLMQPSVPLPQSLNKIHPEKIIHSDTQEYKRFYELPHMVRDGDGRLWVLFRLNRQGYAGHPRMGANWEFYATTFVDGSWIDPILLPLSVGRQNQRVSTLVDRDGRVQVAWSRGDHHVDAPQQVRFGTLPVVSGRIGDPPLEPALTAAPQIVKEERVRSWTVHHKGDSYQVYFGDLHRHTDISLCFPTADGCLVDAYRYALDAAQLDFLAITDHTRDTDPLPWWRTQKANDLFHVNGTFSPIYAYERSNGVVGGGHRNVFFLERDWPVLRSDAHYSYTKQQRPENNNPDVALYPHLRGKNALTAAHTPGYSRQAGRGTWTYHDPQVEPVAEIIQTFRRDYERPGAPQWRDARVQGNLAEEASLWYALARGHKLGFIASSDHHATHTSFACVWARGPKREQIFEALRSRRTYAATDKIILDVRMADALLGEQIPAPDPPMLRIHVRGTAPIEEIQVVRNREVIWKTAPHKIDVETTFQDLQYAGGAAYYYVRVRQTDNNMAWGSPIWIQ